MKDDDEILPVSTPTATLISKKEASDSSLFGRRRYKCWALTGIVLLALWSMFTGTVTLRWSAGNLDSFSHDIDVVNHEDLDVLEMEEKETLVKHMWDVYTNNQRIKLPRFWQQAFEAAYEDMTSDDPSVRQAAISEIAKMSLRVIPFDPPPLETSAMQELHLKQSLISNKG